MSLLREYLPASTRFTPLQNSSSAQHSVVRLEKHRTQFCVGDTLNVLVEMRDHAGRPKAYGGDFILARIHSPQLQASVSGNVVDFRNGSYRVAFPLSWPGEVQVSVLLMHSSEAVRVLWRIRKHNYGKIGYTGTFVRGGKIEKSQCGLRLNKRKALCEYRKKEDGEYYACFRPPTLPCSALSTMHSYNTPGPSLKEEEARLLARWTSSYCQTGPFLEEDAINSCLMGKTVYLMGDSTVRQWIENLERKLKGLVYITVDRLSSMVAADTLRNITVLWNKHTYPWIGSHEISIKKCVYVSRRLDSIEVDGRQQDPVVVIGIGQHFRASPLEIFIQRLLNIRQAILRLQARSPRAQVFIKLENTRELSSDMSRMSDWYGHIENLAQRKVFEDLKVALVDAWDISVAANTFAIHPNDVVVSSEVAVALSHLCHYR
ncbi:NXPE family member 4-like [Megalops cyprinoides]|uniref:NXPE family member 4-like n=1 Tax=Megalops cyprinoides TaxID=118141 RepID=UPI0018650055|nr:NXPE family member 4-like [Megalops cyprinoides]